LARSQAELGGRMAWSFVPSMSARHGEDSQLWCQMGMRQVIGRLLAMVTSPLRCSVSEGQQTDTESLYSVPSNESSDRTGPSWPTAASGEKAELFTAAHGEELQVTKSCMRSSSESILCVPGTKKELSKCITDLETKLHNSESLEQSRRLQGELRDAKEATQQALHVLDNWREDMDAMRAIAADATLAMELAEARAAACKSDMESALEQTAKAERMRREAEAKAIELQEQLLVAKAPSLGSSHHAQMVPVQVPQHAIAQGLHPHDVRTKSRSEVTPIVRRGTPMMTRQNMLTPPRTTQTVVRYTSQGQWPSQVGSSAGARPSIVCRDFSL